MSKRGEIRDLYEHLGNSGMLEFGSKIPGNVVREFLGIVMPEVGTYRMFNSLKLQEVAAIDYIREKLIEQGMFIAADGEDFKILLPSENKVQILAYERSANKKYSRALKLARNTPRKDMGINDQSESRITRRIEACQQLAA